jgi:hypothetical protein
MNRVISVGLCDVLSFVLIFLCVNISHMERDVISKTDVHRWLETRRRCKHPGSKIRRSETFFKYCHIHRALSCWYTGSEFIRVLAIVRKHTFSSMCLYTPDVRKKKSTGGKRPINRWSKETKRARHAEIRFQHTVSRTREYWIVFPGATKRNSS